VLDRDPTTAIAFLKTQFFLIDEMKRGEFKVTYSDALRFVETRSFLTVALATRDAILRKMFENLNI
jgi:hypothetical protein